MGTNINLNTESFAVFDNTRFKKEVSRTTNNFSQIVHYNNSNNFDFLKETDKSLFSHNSRQRTIYNDKLSWR